MRFICLKNIRDGKIHQSMDLCHVEIGRFLLALQLVSSIDAPAVTRHVHCENDVNGDESACSWRSKLERSVKDTNARKATKLRNVALNFEDSVSGEFEDISFDDPDAGGNAMFKIGL